jgi:hypothetical protein
MMMILVSAKYRYKGGRNEIPNLVEQYYITSMQRNHNRLIIIYF